MHREDEDKMRPGTFKLNGISSETYGVFVSDAPARMPPNARWASGAPSNRNGSVFRNLGVYDNTTMAVNAWFVTKDANIDDIYDWLLTDDYVDFTPWYDDKYTYKVLINSDVTADRMDKATDVTTLKFTFTAYPFKYLNETLVKHPVVNNSSFTNPTKFEARPYLEVTPTATGDVTITLNGAVFTFKNPGTTTFTIDSSVPRTSIPDKMVGLDFPIIKPGLNNISYTNISKLNIAEKYVRKAG